MILLTGATGHVGSHLSARLCGCRNVRALAHTANAAARLGGMGFEVIRGSFGNPDVLYDAMASVTRVFLLTPPGPDQRVWEANVIEAAERTSVGHVVKLSTQGVEISPLPALSRQHAESEARLSQSTCSSTLLRPDAFMTNIPNYVNADRITLPAGEARLGFVDPLDIAEVAAHALTASDPPVGPVPITGPEMLSFGEIAARVSAAVGRSIRYEPLAPDEFRDRAFTAGMPTPLIDGLLDLYGKMQSSPPRVAAMTQQELLGQAPRTLEDWLEREGSQLLMSSR